MAGSTKYQVGFVVHQGFQLQHIAGPLATFESVGGFGATPYRARFVSEAGGMIESSAGARLETVRLDQADQLDILFVAGGFSCVEAEQSAAIARFIRAQAKGCRHVGSVCSGTLVLAASGVLDGHRAISHWALNRELVRRYPDIVVDPDKLIVRDDKYWTASTIIGGIEMARLMISEDLGKIASNRACRDLLHYHKPAAANHDASVMEQRIQDLVKWVRDNLAAPLSVERLAEQMGMSARRFVPAFASVTGQTPAKAIERIRLEAAYILVESTDLPVSAVADQVGFMSSERMRRAFIRAFALPPHEMRDLLRKRRPTAPLN